VYTFFPFYAHNIFYRASSKKMANRQMKIIALSRCTPWEWSGTIADVPASGWTSNRDEVNFAKLLAGSWGDIAASDELAGEDAY
jgi:hypothetical protein